MTGPAPAEGRAAARRGRRVAAVATAVLLLLAAAGCGGDDGGATPGRAVEGSAPADTTGDPAPTSEAPAPTEPDPSGPDDPAEEGAPPPGPLGEVAVVLTEVARLDAPTKLVGRPGSDVLYVAEQAGRVVALPVEDDQVGEPSTALDLTDVTTSGGEQGLLGLAFSPDGATLHVHHSGLDGETRIASFAMDGDTVDPASRTDLLTVDQPYPNHNGGDLVVDADGLLWIGLGDGGRAGDPEDRAQDPDDLLGKVLRIDPTAPADGRPYGIPDDNPYATGGGRPEIAVSGVRNPWRLRFDPATGDLWIADVGQDALEEIDHLPAGEVLGANLGWSRFEGSAPYDESREVRDGPAVPPVFEMSHDDGWCSLTGGPVYRGSRLPALAGAYLFGDYCKTGINALRLGDDGAVADTAVLADGPEQLVSLDTDAAGEVYALSLDGVVARLDPA